jgi:hypothetical protein
MSKERELLARASTYLEAYWNSKDADPETSVYKLYREIDRFLAEPVQESEPVGLILNDATFNSTGFDKRQGRVVWIKNLNEFHDGGELYATPPDAAKRIVELERVCEGLSQDAIDGGFTVKGLQDYAKQLESELAGLRDAYCGAMNAKDLMLPALRQHRHNFGSEEFIAAYDYDEANKIVDRLIAENEALRTQLAAIREPLNDDVIKETYLATGFKIQEGLIDLKPYVYKSAHAIHQAILARIKGE